ncbi:MAG: FAD-dependent oxidoreductase [Phycisphaerae bacterium]
MPMTRPLPAVLALVAGLSLFAPAVRAQQVLVEAESFAEPGGWSVDTQFTHIMGSPYLLAHGLGEPVKDATTTVKFPSAGQYKVFVRTKDWVARWKAEGAPGKFQLLIDGKPLAETFGTKGADWFWHDGGTVEITKTDVPVAIKDLTGFDGRVDAIVFSKDANFTPSNDVKELAAWRKKTLGLPAEPVDAGEFDIVVVGGGYGGMGAAISASRMGCKVALIQDRPVLGGNGSSEIQVWSMGGTTLGKYPKLGEIVEEFADSAKSSPGTIEEYGDEKKEVIVKAEKNIKLFLSTQAFAVEMDGNKIKSVTARNVKTSEELKFRAKLFADTTGHGHIGALAGAEFTMADGSNKENLHMGMSNMWKWVDAGQPVSFPETPWALQLSLADFPLPKAAQDGKWGKAEWFWEGGFFRHPINDLEYIRDWNLRAAYGAFNTMKNGEGKAKYANAKLAWLAYVGGTRESRLLTGDLVLSREDIVNKVDYDDGFVPTTWSIDLHVPKEQYAKKYPEDPFISRAIFGEGVDKKNGYPVPYRCFYSKNVVNLFMAGRNISVNREALGTIRVMRTGGMMGEIVGKAASICVKHNALPRDVYEKHLPELKELANLPGRARRETVTAQIDENAPLPATESLQRAKPHRREEGGTAAAGALSIDPAKLAGLVIDDAKATFNGKWSKGTGLKPYVGTSYAYSQGGDASAKFAFEVKEPGSYEVRFSYSLGHENRSKTVPVTVTSADGDKSITIDQQAQPGLENGFISLGTFKFDKAGSVTVSNKGAQGTIAVDAIQVLPATK